MMHTCENCMYCVPMATPKGLYTVCLNPESIRIYQAVRNDDRCREWFWKDDPCLKERSI